MKINTELFKQLTEDLAASQAIQASLDKEEKLVADSAAELADLETSANLFDKAALGRLAALTTISQVGPKRLQARRQELADALETLTETGDAFTLQSLRPRYQEIEVKALDKVEGKLKLMFPDPETLRQAAFNSTTLKELLPVNEHISIGPDRDIPGRRAGNLIQAWQALDAFEKKHLS